jgi:hypothetical protein
MVHRDSINHMASCYGRLVVGLCVTLLLIVGATATAAPAPKKLTTAKPGDCAACHGVEKVLPSDHKATKTMTYKDCLECHEKGGAMSLRTKVPASHLHQLSGVNCVKCHGKTKKPKEVEMKGCVACHKTDTVAQATAKVKPQNPHESPHYGTSLDCNLCHHQHSKSENYCSQCHKFDFVVP